MKTLILLAACCTASTAFAAEQPYSGQQTRAIKALSAEEVKGYLAGAGMGFARTAELNSYPGPMHALELADRLDLTATQRVALEALMQRHKAEARALGAELIARECELDALFADRRATATLVDVKLAEIGALQARIRGSHLKTHLEATALLQPAQITRYDTLRGYRGAAAPEAHRHAH